MLGIMIVSHFGAKGLFSGARCVKQNLQKDTSKKKPPKGIPSQELVLHFWYSKVSFKLACLLVENESNQMIDITNKIVWGETFDNLSIYG